MTPRQAAAAPAADAGLRIERRKREATSRGPNFSEAMRAAREPLRKSDDKSESSGSLCPRKNRRDRLFLREHPSEDLHRDGERRGTTRYGQEGGESI